MDINTLKANIFPGESGGDYNALFGYANRPGGAFEGVNLTDMTVADAIRFSDPSGPYAQHVKRQLGYVATPMGGYQVVGKTLRAAAEGLGLRGDERFDQATQDRIGMWIYQNQGPEAWEAWGKGGGGGGGGPAPLRASTSGQGGGTMGLFDMMDQEPQTFGEKVKAGFKDGSVWNRVALAANTLRMDPDQQLAQLMQERMSARASDTSRNRTAQWLASKGRTDLAEAMLAGGLDPQQAMAAAMAPPEDNRTAMIQNYEYWLAQGKTPQEAAEMARAGAGGATVNVNSGEDKFADKFAEQDATILSGAYSAGLAANRALGQIDQLDKLLQTAPQGAEGAFKLFAGQLGIATENLDEVQAADALISSLVPAQRPPGSGTMSDADLALFRASLPQIMNQPGGNQLIIQTIRGIAQYDAAGAAIADRLRNGEIDRATAFRELRTRPNPLSGFKAPPAAAAPGAPGAAPAVPQVNPNTLKYLGIEAP